MILVNKNEAPEGCIAKYSYDGQCNGCCFYRTGRCNNKGITAVRCMSNYRKDGCNVIFIKDSPVQPVQFNNELLNKLAEECGLYICKDNIEESMKEIEFFASEVFKAGVEYGKLLAEQGEVQ